MSIKRMQLTRTASRGLQTPSAAGLAPPPGAAYPHPVILLFPSQQPKRRNKQCA
jgi:hypothetical protein